jgi:hypothetical protein
VAARKRPPPPRRSSSSTATFRALPSRGLLQLQQEGRALQQVFSFGKKAMQQQQPQAAPPPAARTLRPARVPPPPRVLQLVSGRCRPPGLGLATETASPLSSIRPPPPARRLPPLCRL